MSNYACVIAKVDAVFPIEKADNIQIAKVLGETVVVGKYVGVGDIGVFFRAGTQLSEAYATNNNLYRDVTKNFDATQSGFFEDSRRVRAQPFLKVKSEAYFAALQSLNFAGDISTLKLGDSFEEFNEVKICNKYISEATQRMMSTKGNKPSSKNKKIRVVPYFEEHVQTNHFNSNLHNITAGDLVSIQSKRHGTSFRVGYNKVIKTLTGWKAFIQKFIPVFVTETYELTVGTRRVVLNNPEADGFHGSEAYRFEVAEELTPYLQKGMSIYGEIVGYVNGKPIMEPHKISKLKDKLYTKKYGDEIVYKYGALENTYKFHIYRITLTTEDGTSVDFTQHQVVEWCKNRGLEPAYDVVKPFIYDGDEEALKLLVSNLTERPEALTEDYHDASHISEGVIIRVDRGTNTPLFLKSKSYAFRVLEGHVEAADPEDAA